MNTHRPTHPTLKKWTAALVVAALLAPGLAHAEVVGGSGSPTPAAAPTDPMASWTDWLLDLVGLAPAGGGALQVTDTGTGGATDSAGEGTGASTQGAGNGTGGSTQSAGNGTGAP